MAQAHQSKWTQPGELDEVDGLFWRYQPRIAQERPRRLAAVQGVLAGEFCPYDGLFEPVQALQDPEWGHQVVKNVQDGS